MLKQSATSARRLAPRLQYWETHGGSESPLLGIRDHVREHGMPDTRAVRRLARRLRMPEAMVRSVASYYTDLKHTEPCIQVCQGTSCRLAGSEKVRQQLLAKGRKCRAVYCLGFCDRSPAVLDEDEGAYVLADARNFPETDEDAMPRRAHPLPDIRSHAKTPIVTRRLGGGSAFSFDTARELGAYTALEAALQNKPEAVIQTMKDSGERGRGGAGFSAAAKWKSAAETPAEKRYVIANGDEGDPGSFVDRVLMEEDPHSILEGMLLCGYAIGADEGILYVRSEYPRAIENLQRAIDEARGEGFIGDDICGSGFSFHIWIYPGMGSYGCGEETAMINAIEGLRGEVQIRPPYPTNQGLFGQPTVVNNVETLVNVPFIVGGGPAEYRKLGADASSGTKALCLNHGFARPGIVEVEFGISLREVIEDLGGGGRDGKQLAAVIVGGPMGSIVTPKDWDVAVCYEAMSKRGIQLGHGGIVALPEDTDFRGLLEHWVQFMVDESCGKCAPCRLGSQCAANLLTREANERQIRVRLDEVFTAMEMGSLCAFGELMPGPMRQLIEHFGDEIFNC